MRAWVYKVNSRLPRQRLRRKRRSGQGLDKPVESGWHFDQYFRYRGRGRYDMGGREWIRSPSSWACLSRVRRGDLFVCYQTDERKIYGLARTAGPGYESVPGSGIFDSVDFAPGGLRLKNPVDVRPRRRGGAETPSLSRGAVFQHIRAFSVPSRGTVHALARDELRALLDQLAAFNPAQERRIRAFARRPRRNFL